VREGKQSEGFEVAAIYRNVQEFLWEKPGQLLRPFLMAGGTARNLHLPSWAGLGEIISSSPAPF